ncbi:M15 family metallopeptidase [Streptomyces sp. NPDC051940]|uniref:M15 family metallopeptidase n=1 Tax=Streptomyces sp. NPDC051940 TaxID=3155675 RepID=UPI003423035A
MPLFASVRRALLLSAVLLSAAASTAAADPGPADRTPAAPDPVSRAARAPREFVALDDVDPTILRDIRYAGPHNFTGARVPGYDEPLCVLTRPAARALARAQGALRKRGYSLKVYDCYRPQRAVDRFVRWAADPRDTLMRTEFYPNLPKSRLFADGYLAERSGHSRGSEVDITLVRLPAVEQAGYRPGQRLTPCTARAGKRFADNSIDMGTGYDCFDTLSHTLSPAVTGKARSNRLLLKDALEREGFRNFRYEWWHFNFRPEPFERTRFDFPVRRASLRRDG